MMFILVRINKSNGYVKSFLIYRHLYSKLDLLLFTHQKTQDDIFYVPY